MMERDKRYADLPEKTRLFFENLHDEDITLLQDGLRMVRATQTVSKFVKWLIISLVGIFVATVGLAESIMKVMAWIRSPRG